MDVEDLKNKLEEMFDYKTDLSDSLFDYVSLDEFNEYLCNRYGRYFVREVVNVYYYINYKGDK